VEGIQQEQDARKTVGQVLQKHGTNQHTRRGDYIVISSQGNGVPYLKARLARDHPTILAAYKRGAYPSVRQAAIAAGIIREKTPLDHLRHWWGKATQAEREAFMAACNGQGEDATP